MSESQRKSIAIEPINAWKHLAVLGVLSCLGGYGAWGVNASLNEWAIARTARRQHQGRLERLGQQGELERTSLQEKGRTGQVAEANRVDTYDSVRLPEYVCNPEQRPRIDSRWADPAGMDPVEVVDAHGIIVGRLYPTGAFEFFACQ